MTNANQSSPEPDAWETPQSILVILAHPDDPEFFCGATLARWAAAGHLVRYVLITCGDKGDPRGEYLPGQLCTDRVDEQKAAAAVIGAQSVRFLGIPDGEVVPDMALRKEITRVIRQERPDILVTCDPELLYSMGGVRLNHPDHRAAGQVVLDAAFPAAGSCLFFPELLEEDLQPHTPREIWVSIPKEPTVTLDVTDFWETKIRALFEHRSQIGEPEKLAERMRARHTPDSTPENPRYEEKFRKLTLG